jgi:predicted DNA-binding transcriptional regulator AlpA
MAIDSTHEDRLLELNDVIEILGAKDVQKAELVKLKLFAGMSVEEAGEVLGISTATAYRLWNCCARPTTSPRRVYGNTLPPSRGSVRIVSSKESM